MTHTRLIAIATCFALLTAFGAQTLSYATQALSTPAQAHSAYTLAKWHHKGG